MTIIDKYEVLDKDRQRLDVLATIHKFWIIKSPEGSILYRSHAEKKENETGDNLDTSLDILEQNNVYPFVQISFGSSNSTCKEHYYLVFDENAFEKLKKGSLNGKNKSVGDGSNANNAFISKKDLSYFEKKEADFEKKEAEVKAENQRIIAEREALQNQKFEIMEGKMMAQMKNEIDRLRAEQVMENCKKEFEILKIQLESEYKLKTQQLENLKEQDKIEQERAWEEIDKKEKELEQKIGEAEEEKEKYLLYKNKYKKKLKGNGEIIEAVSQNLGTAAKKFFGSATGFDGIFAESTPTENLGSAESSKDTTKEKRPSFKERFGKTKTTENNTN